MYTPHQGTAAGLPNDYDFAQGPLLKKAPEIFFQEGWFTATTVWGQVYRDDDYTLVATNTRVELQNLRYFYHTISDNTWHELWNEQIITDGAGYCADYHDDTTVNISRFEVDGNISCVPTATRCFHFYSEQIEILNSSDIDHVLTSCQARMILDNPEDGTDDRANAHYLVAMGADKWRYLNAPWLPDFSNNGDIGMGHFTVVPNDGSWVTVNFSTVKNLTTDTLIADLNANVPTAFLTE